MLPIPATINTNTDPITDLVILVAIIVLLLSNASINANEHRTDK